jgi:hypothetical protein
MSNATRKKGSGKELSSTGSDSYTVLHSEGLLSHRPLKEPLRKLIPPEGG